MTGYITAIDDNTGTITVGASYYKTGSAWVTSATKVSLDNIARDLNMLEVGDWAKMRIEWYTKIATKISVTTIPSP